MTHARTSYMAHRDGEEPAPDDPLLDFAPAPHVAPRKNSITAERQRAFVAHLAATGIVAEAARHVGASLEALYKLRHKPGAETPGIELWMRSSSASPRNPNTMQRRGRTGLPAVPHGCDETLTPDVPRQPVPGSSATSTRAA